MAGPLRRVSKLVPKEQSDPTENVSLNVNKCMRMKYRVLRKWPTKGCSTVEEERWCSNALEQTRTSRIFSETWIKMESSNLMRNGIEWLTKWD